MSADAFFRMGSSHAICQDYAIAGRRLGYCDVESFAILSDGCSGVTVKNGRTTLPISALGEPFTDWGARLLVVAAWQRLGPISEGHFPERAIARSANAWARQIDVPETALDATLLVAAAMNGGGVQVFATGDGVVAWRERSGRIWYEATRFPNGMPRYLSYLLDPGRHAGLFDAVPGEGDPIAGTMERTSNVWTPGEGWGIPLVMKEQFVEGSRYARARYFSSRQGGEHPAVDVVALFSDGIESFQDGSGNAVPLEAVLEELLAIKSLQGEFVTRRCRKFLEKTCAERGWKHSDDFSMAAVGFEEAESRQQTADSPEKKSGGERT